MDNWQNFQNYWHFNQGSPVCSRLEPVHTLLVSGLAKCRRSEEWRCLKTKKAATGSARLQPYHVVSGFNRLADIEDELGLATASEAVSGQNILA